MKALQRCIPFALLATIVMGLGLGCAQQVEPLSPNYVAQSPNANRVIGESEPKFVVLGNQALWEGVRDRRIKLSESKTAAAILNDLSRLILPPETVSPEMVHSDSLVLGFPIGMLGERYIFGGIITKVSDRKSEDLGSLKLSGLDPLHVRLQVAKSAEDFALALVGCINQCTESSEVEPLMGIPIIGVDEERQLLLLDMAAVAEKLNLIDILDPGGEFTNLVTKSVSTKVFDYSLSTLVFDVDSVMIPKVSALEAPAETVLTSRWYLKLESAFHSSFESRPAVNGVGYFMTARAKQPKINRFALEGLLPGQETGMVKYYIKNVPDQFLPAFQGAFDDWNDLFVKHTGRPIFSYEVVKADDPRSSFLVPGDIRYNIVEWDLVNEAPYGGLGPVTANQFTGEIVSGNVLIQGPGIIDTYTRWFATADKAQSLTEDGEAGEAHRLLVAAREEIHRRLHPQRKQFRLVATEKLELNIPSLLERLSDPMVKREDFELLPKGVSFDTYMAGYFRDMVTHELGHNLGLRHNFKGNLFSAASPHSGNVSASIMEYLGRPFRYLDSLGSYDHMAIRYGYLGVLPERTDMFCTDENVPSPISGVRSAECSRDDATSDPFLFFEKKLGRAIDLLIARGKPEASTWKLDQMGTEIAATVLGMGFYASSAETTGTSWKTFFTGGERPTAVSGVKPYVVKHLKAQLCDPSLQAVVQGKSTEEAKKVTEKNIESIRQKVKTLLEPLEILSPEALKCLVTSE